MAISIQMNQRVRALPRSSLMRTSRSRIDQPTLTSPKLHWTYGELLRWTHATFAAAGLSEPALKAEFYCADFFAKPRLELFRQFDQPLSWNERTLALYAHQVGRPFYSDLPRRAFIQHEPFLGRLFQVGDSCFVPRPETENLVEAGIRFLKIKSQTTSDMLAVLDSCTGPGCVGISLALAHEKARVHAVDLDPKAVKQAEINITVHGLDTRVRVLNDFLFPWAWLSTLEALTELHRLREIGTRLSTLRALYLENTPRPTMIRKFRNKIHPPFDLIVSNPPYSPTEKVHGAGWLGPFIGRIFGKNQDLARNGGKTGTDVIRQILQDAPRFLKSDGALLLEIGGGQEAEVLAIAQSIPFWRSVKVLENNRSLSSVFMASPLSDFDFSSYENPNTAPNINYLSPQRPRGGTYWKRTRRALTHELATRLTDLQSVPALASSEGFTTFAAACAAEAEKETHWGNGSNVPPDELELVRLHVQAIDQLETHGLVGRHFNLSQLRERENNFGPITSIATLYVLMEALERKLAEPSIEAGEFAEGARFQIQLADDFLASRRNIYGERISQGVTHHWRQIEHGLTYYLNHL